MMTIKVKEIVVKQAEGHDRGVVEIIGYGLTVEGRPCRVVIETHEVIPCRSQEPGEIADDVVCHAAKMALRAAYEAASTHGAESITLETGAAVALLRQATADLRKDHPRQEGGTETAFTRLKRTMTAGGFNVPTDEEIRETFFANNGGEEVNHAHSPRPRSFWGGILTDLAWIIEAACPQDTGDRMMSALVDLQSEISKHEGKTGKLLPPPVVSMPVMVTPEDAATIRAAQALGTPPGTVLRTSPTKRP